MRIFVFIVVLFLGACSATLPKSFVDTDMTPYDPDFFNQDVSLGYNDRHTDGLSLTHTDEETATVVHTCTDYFEKLQAGYYARTTFDRTMESFFIRVCYPLAFLKQAENARFTHFHRPYFHDDILDTLPPEMGEIARVNRHKLCASSQSLKDCLYTNFTDLTPKTIDIDAFSISIDTPHEYGGYEIMAKGDLNGDGWEDLSVHYYYGIKSATWRSYGHFCMEYPKMADRPKILPCLEDIGSNVLTE